MKESYLLEVAEYAVAQSIDNEPAFVWWVPYTLKKRDRSIAAVSKRYHKHQCKYGFRILDTVEEMKDFRRKSRYVSGGHTVDARATLTYASIVSREDVLIALKVKASDINVMLGEKYGSRLERSSDPTLASVLASR